MFFLQARARQREAQRVLVRFLNETNLEAAKVTEDRRSESRTDVSVGIWVFPLRGKTPAVDDAFPAVTKDASTSGLALIVNESISADDVLLHLPTDSEPQLLRAKVCGCRPIGAGFHLLATEIVELLTAREYPEFFGVELEASTGAPR